MKELPADISSMLEAFCETTNTKSDLLDTPITFSVSIYV